MLPCYLGSVSEMRRCATNRMEVAFFFPFFCPRVRAQFCILSFSFFPSSVPFSRSRYTLAMAAVAVSAATRITRKRVASAMSVMAPVTSSTNTRGKKSAAAAPASRPVQATDKSGSSVKHKTLKDDTPGKKKSPAAASSTKLTPNISSIAVAPAALIPQPSAEPFVKATPWTSLSIPRSELDLSTTLKCGQSFRWHREHVELPSGEISLPIYSCILDHRLWCIQETEDGFKYRTFRPTAEAPPQKGWSLPPPTLVSPYFAETGNRGNLGSDIGSARPGAAEESKDLTRAMEEDRQFLEGYLQLHVPLADLYEKWSATDQNFKAKAPFFPGVRILRQDPVENLVCFICSSNNNIARISQMVRLVADTGCLFFSLFFSWSSIILFPNSVDLHVPLDV